MSRNPRRYKSRVGNGPWTCYLKECGEIITFLGLEGGHVHHIDEDESNDDPSNLAVMHGPCHHILHKVGKESPIKGGTHTWGSQISKGLKGHRGAHRGWTPKAREALAETQRERLAGGLQKTDEYRTRMSEATKGHRGRTFTDEQRQRQSHLLRESAKSWPVRECECGLKTKSAGALGTHRKASGHKEVTS